MDGLENMAMGSRRKELVAPCKGFPRKTPGCHDQCSDYMEFKAVVSQKNEYLRKNERPKWDCMAGKWRREL